MSRVDQVLPRRHKVGRSFNARFRWPKHASVDICDHDDDLNSVADWNSDYHDYCKVDHEDGAKYKCFCDKLLVLIIVVSVVTAVVVSRDKNYANDSYIIAFYIIFVSLDFIHILHNYCTCPWFWQS